MLLNLFPLFLINSTSSDCLSHFVIIASDILVYCISCVIIPIDMLVYFISGVIIPSDLLVYCISGAKKTESFSSKRWWSRENWEWIPWWKILVSSSRILVVEKEYFMNLVAFYFKKNSVNYFDCVFLRWQFNMFLICDPSYWHVKLLFEHLCINSFLW